MHPETTVDLAEIQPEALYTGTRQIEITPLVGRPVEQGHYVETIRLARYDKIVSVTTGTVGPLDGDVTFSIARTTELAEVAFTNELDALRRDGWELAQAELPATEEAPF